MDRKAQINGWYLVAAILAVLAILRVRETSSAGLSYPRGAAMVVEQSFPSDLPNSHVRRMLGRKDEVWIAESGTERLRVIRR